ncbi:hypothetical protein JOQ06_021304 [Pogonophryne albipinna]|uniref:Cystatin fetuin-B-type domain-containing protein n=1 Tax=Pogonophryne albipinna TaxID=1090488 RepID=A0AAD6F6S9_9TELE|nr:hypothetical protein JOQ06_021304 [Pogonophryne albipinna]
MKHCGVVVTAVGVGCVRAAPVETVGIEEGSCEDASAKGAAGLAITKINQDRQEGYIFALHHLSNVHMIKHGETGVGFLPDSGCCGDQLQCSEQEAIGKSCEARPDEDTPVYGQCKVAIFISKVHRLVRLYKYQCVVRPVPSARVTELCPDCPTPTDMEDAEIKKTVSLSLEKFNNMSGLSNRFALLKINRAKAGMAMSMYYNADYTIQETTCPRSSAASDDCPLMDCEFAHKGHCKASLFYSPTGEALPSADCEIYEPEVADREKKHHELGGETDHSQTDNIHTATTMTTHDAADDAHTHDHAHDHTKSHDKHDKNQQHANNSDHHHTHRPRTRQPQAPHATPTTTGTATITCTLTTARRTTIATMCPNQHHNYKHADSEHTHEHDHEVALDHDHKPPLARARAPPPSHEHEHENASHDHPEGMGR